MASSMLSIASGNRASQRKDCKIIAHSNRQLISNEAPYQIVFVIRIVCWFFIHSFCQIFDLFDGRVQKCFGLNAISAACNFQNFMIIHSVEQTIQATNQSYGDYVGCATERRSFDRRFNMPDVHRLRHISIPFHLKCKTIDATRCAHSEFVGSNRARAFGILFLAGHSSHVACLPTKSPKRKLNLSQIQLSSYLLLSRTEPISRTLPATHRPLERVPHNRNKKCRGEKSFRQHRKDVMNFVLLEIYQMTFTVM